MAHDVGRGVTVVAGGLGADFGERDDLWEYNGDTWTQHTPSTSVSVEPGTLVYDPLRAALLYAGGDGTWAWDGTDWVDQGSTAVLDAASSPSVVFDAAMGAAFAVRGSERCPFCEDVWLLSSDGDVRPGQRFEASFAAAEVEHAAVRSVTIRWTVGASGTPGGVVEGGAELLVWDGFGWALLDAHASGEDAPETLCVRLVADEGVPPEPSCTDRVDPELVAGLFQHGEDATAAFAVRPTAGVGMDRAIVKTDDVSVTVRYRMPEGG